MTTTLPLLANETDLAARAAGEPSAFAIIYDHYFPKVYNYVRYRVRDVDVADEITALVFERVLTGIGSYRPQKAPFGAWLFSIARNAVHDHHRSTSRHPWLPLDLIAAHPAADPLPEEAVEQKDASARLLQAVRQLAPREQDLIALKFASGLENKEIAKVVGLSESHVGVILFRALRRLRNLLGDKENSHE
ncbi:MAG: sigma-70 family RNA polymerase sigma factor [Anaerolineales bacterium]|nr:sigma-70 family RNA polymerase sigma factor [Anaerolineales bacterium]